MSTEQESTEKKLTPKQERFVQAYIGPARFNASEAVRLAGYRTKNPDDMGYQLRNTPYIRTRIDRLLEANSLNGTEVLRELTDVAMRRLDEFIEITRYNADGDPIAAKMDASAKLKALDLLGRHHKLFTDNVHQSGGISIEIAGVDVEQI